MHFDKFPNDCRTHRTTTILYWARNTFPTLRAAFGFSFRGFDSQDFNGTFILIGTNMEGGFT